MSSIYNDPAFQKAEPPVAGIFTGTPIEIEEQPPFPPAESGARLGTKFCGCCCDYRRATIIMDVIVVALLIIYLAVIQSQDYWYSDYGNEEEWDDFRVTASILLALCIITTCLAILGAIYYSVFLVGLGALSLLVTYIVDTVLLVNLCNNWGEDDYSDCEVSEGGLAFRFLMAVFFIYPNVGFIVQVCRGIMSPATYERERAGCC